MCERLRRVGDGATNLANEDIQVRFDDVGVRPDSRQQGGLLDDVGPAFEQGAQEVERLRGQRDLAILRGQSPCPRVDGEGAEADVSSRARHYGILLKSLRLGLPSHDKRYESWSHGHTTARPRFRAGRPGS